MAENKMYLTVSKNPKGLVAVISQGQPQYGDKAVTVLAVEVVKNMKAARAWYRRMKTERPWDPRH